MEVTKRKPLGVDRMFDLNKVINGLAKERPVFHSEADFQHALAWEIRQMHKKLKVRLEYPLEHSLRQAHVDIMLLVGKKKIAIELKYKTSKLKTLVNEELFKLSGQSAQGAGRYDFWKDTSRIERLFNHGQILMGFVIFLTNDHLYWDCTRKNANDTKFRLTDGLRNRKQLTWPKNLIKTTKNDSVLSRKTPIKISGKYTIHWKKYSRVQIEKDVRNGQFRYLMLNVGVGLAPQKL